MAISKVVAGGEVLLDLTKDTVSEETLAKGVTAHDKAGNQYKYIDGTVQERTADEIQADRNAIPPAPQVMSAEEMTAILNALTEGVDVNG